MIAVPANRIVPLGQIVATPAALEAIEDADQEPKEFLARHRQGDWGDVCGDDWEANDRDLDEGNRLLSAYQTGKGVNLWVITEADRSSTCLLLPEEY
jgi:hypothetical protein